MKQVLFWSKYSANSKKLINLMDQYNANIESVCIDNESVRQRIAKDKKIGISVVPTILAVYQNGVIEKYEGEKAFELLYAAFPQKPSSSVSRATIKMQELPSPSCEGMGSIQEPVPALVENEKPKKSEYLPQSLQEKDDKDSSGQSSLDDLTGDDLFNAESSGDSADDKDEKNETGRGDASTNNLPIKANSKLSSIAADIAASRDQMDANMPRPTQNNIKPV